MASRYSRQTALPEIGEAGQLLLGKAKILCVGAGGLGSSALLYLVAAGVGLAKDGGRIGIVDDDHVDCSNLQRQILYREVDQGLSKVEQAIAHLSSLNSETALVAHHTKLGPSNVLQIMSEYDVIVDGTDNFPSKYLINDAAVRLGKPVVYGAILGFEGHVSTFWGAHGPCYRCMYPDAIRSHVPNCEQAGTLGGVAGVVGSIQAVEACKLALGLDFCQKHGLETLVGQLLIVDASHWDIRKLALEPAKACSVCAISPCDIVLPVMQDVISQQDLSDLLATGQTVTLVDVREHHEWRKGHLSGAIHFPLNTLLADDHLQQRINPSSTVLVYCQHGQRSAQAVSHLRTQGYEALNLMVDWSV